METDEHFIFPREKPGLDYNLNWSLNQNQVTPCGDAFRLTKAKDVAKLGAGPAVEVPKPSDDDVPPEAGEEALSFAAFDTALSVVRSSLSETATLYVVEGDAPGTRIPCRVISDDLVIASAAITGILERMPLRQPTALPITCFVTSSGENFSGLVVEQGDGVVYPEDDNVASVVLSGDCATPVALSAGISAAALALEE
eukprot:CAMPEP_0185773090 /NCGR_PEP_ID=MMETSP1174-20130828/72285_1 /TAXON_ID=35687 /ORGANISM="Dictyocha speculum, Strain CCMP1381" /LENGTH=197 /DNA_ID=CAMNT_0028459635 /DNA_START=80 /DNA_END=673 /DNA_ORIENTATION=+